MTTFLRKIGITVASASITCAAVLACAWPTETQAGDTEAAVVAVEGVAFNTTKIGKVEATSRLVEDPKVKGRWLLEVSVHNTGTEGVETVELEEQLLKAVYQPMMARGGPMPTVAWKHKEKVELRANETAVTRHPIPAWLNWQVTNAQKPPRVNKDGFPLTPTTEFSTSIEQVAAAPANTRSQSTKL